MADSIVRPTDALAPIVVVGPTAVGKTDFAILLAHALGGEIISIDSVQVYRGLDIGSAKPTVEERGNIPFHLIDIIDPDETYTASHWKIQASAKISDIQSRGKRPILAGGTGMYLRALLRNWTMGTIPRSDTIRVELEQLAVTAGAAEIHEKLNAIDPETAARLHPNDLHRTIRALEVCLITGDKFSSFHAADSSEQACGSNFVPSGIYALTLPRENLYNRVNNRVDTMVQNGLEAEARHLLSKGYTRDLPSLNTLGYKEMNSYIHGESNLEEAIETIKMMTRRYAKRQLTWFRAEPEIEWIDLSIIGLADAAARIVQAQSTVN